MPPRTHHEPDPWRLAKRPGNGAGASDSGQPCPIQQDEPQNSGFIAFGCVGFFVCVHEGDSEFPIPRLPQQSGSAGSPKQQDPVKDRLSTPEPQHGDAAGPLPHAEAGTAMHKPWKLGVNYSQASIINQSINQIKLSSDSTWPGGALSAMDPALEQHLEQLL